METLATQELQQELPMGYMTAQYVEVEFVDYGLDDDLFDFDSKLEQSIDQPDDDEFLKELNLSFDRIIASGDYEKLMYASGQLAAAACTHNHLEDVANKAMNELFGGHDEHDGHDHEAHKEKNHTDSCKSKSGGKCSCKKS